MWLLDTSTFELKNFLGKDIPPYAILSHTWETMKSLSLKSSGKKRVPLGRLDTLKCCEQAQGRALNFYRSNS